VTIFYPDVSNNNWSSSQDLYNFLAQLGPQGFAGVCHKISEGNYYDDPYGSECQQWCADNKVPFIGYHYVTENDPAEQAQNWLDSGGGTVAMFDFEANSGDMDNFWAVANAFNAAGVNVQMGYIPNWYWSEVGGGDLSQVPVLVSSAYPIGSTSGFASSLYDQCDGDDGEGWDTYGGAEPTCWQFTDNASVSPFTGIDCNAYRGTDDLATVFGQTAPAPPAPPAPPTPPAPTDNGDGPLSALSDAQQIDVYNLLVVGVQQLTGPFDPPVALLQGGTINEFGNGWPQLGQNGQGQNLTLVDAVAAIETGVGSLGNVIGLILQTLSGAPKPSAETPETK
jgi:Glycosyl hydrolases family 25